MKNHIIVILFLVIVNNAFSQKIVWEHKFKHDIPVSATKVFEAQDSSIIFCYNINLDSGVCFILHKLSKIGAIEWTTSVASEYKASKYLPGIFEITENNNRQIELLFSYNQSGNKIQRAVLDKRGKLVSNNIINTSEFCRFFRYKGDIYLWDKINDYEVEIYDINELGISLISSWTFDYSLHKGFAFLTNCDNLMLEVLNPDTLLFTIDIYIINNLFEIELLKSYHPLTEYPDSVMDMIAANSDCNGALFLAHRDADTRLLNILKNNGKNLWKIQPFGKDTSLYGKLAIIDEKLYFTHLPTNGIGITPLPLNLVEVSPDSKTISKFIWENESELFPYFNNIIGTSDKNIIVDAYSLGLDSGYYIAKLDFQETSSIKQLLPYNKLNVYPNPCAEEITILFRVNQDNSDVELSIQDINGKTEKIAYKILSIGVYKFKHNTKDLSNGLYFIHMILNGKASSYPFIKYN